MHLLCYIWKFILILFDGLAVSGILVPFIAGRGLATWLAEIEIIPAVQISMSPS